jgi:hypothetical protein
MEFSLVLVDYLGLLVQCCEHGNIYGDPIALGFPGTQKRGPPATWKHGLTVAEERKRRIFGWRGGRRVGADERSKVPTGVFGQGHPGLIIDQASTTKVLLTIHQAALHDVKIREDAEAAGRRGDAGHIKLGICNAATHREKLPLVRRCFSADSLIT